MTREEAARAFAEAIGWKFDGEAWDERNQFRGGAPNKYGEHPQRFRFPAPDAPLHEQLEFVGRIAESLAPRDVTLTVVNGFALVQFIRSLNECVPGSASGGKGIDPSWAALLAGIAALKAGGK